MMRIQKNIFQLVVSLGIVLMAAGCAQNTTLVYEPITGLNANPQLNGRVVLLLTPSFENYSTVAPISEVRLSLGGALSKYAEDSMRPLFRDLTIVHANALPSGSPPTMVLVPNVTSAYTGVAWLATTDRPVSITIQWTLQDQNGAVIWNTAVMGDAHGNLGNAFTFVDDYLRDFSIAAAKAFRTSNERMASSPEVLTALKVVQ
jgi:hypothetical protein